MPGNEHTVTFFGSLAIVAFLRNERRERPTLPGDALAGLLVGLALLSKFSGFLSLAAIGAAMFVRFARQGPARRNPRRFGARIAAFLSFSLVLCGPYYARNVREFGVPFKLSRDFALVQSVEGDQPPGARSWLDYVAISPRLLRDPDPRAPHLLHSVWGTVYVNTWTDTRRALRPQREGLARPLLWLGLVPTALFLAGFAISLRRSIRADSDSMDLTLVLLATANLGGLAVMAWQIPIYSLLKASYLLLLSLPTAFFLARALDAIAERRRRALVWLASIGVASAALATALVFTPGFWAARGGASPHMAVVHAHFGAWERSRSIFDDYRVRRAGRWLVRRVWLRETLAGVLLQSGDAAGARAAYEEAMAQAVPRSPHLEPRSSPWLANRWAVAAALSGDRDAALVRLDEALVNNPMPELLVNRGALKVLADDLVGAEADLREAIVRTPTLVPAWCNLARVLELRGLQEAVQAAETAQQLADRAPRGFPYGVGDGFHLNGQRFMLVLEENRLALYRPGRARGPEMISIMLMRSGLPPPWGTTVSSPFSATHNFLKLPGIFLDENTYMRTSACEMKSGARR
jgi:tetratricopeptide (TPR) repeat protein